MKIGCRALAFHIFKNLRLFYKKIVAGLGYIFASERFICMVTYIFFSFPFSNTVM